MPSDDELRSLLPVVQERLPTLGAIGPLVGFLWVETVPVDVETLVPKRWDAATTLAGLTAARKVIAETGAVSFEADELEPPLRALAEERGWKAGDLFMAIRVAVTGRTATPPLFDTLVALGRDRDARAPGPRHRRAPGGVIRTPATRVALIVVAGLATGILTQIGQGALPGDWSQLANAITPWLLVAFLLGSACPTPAGRPPPASAALLLALIGYYGMVQLRYGYGGGTGSLDLLGARGGGRRSGVRRRRPLVARAGPSTAGDRPRPARGGRHRRRGVQRPGRRPRDRRGRVHRLRAARARSSSGGRATTGSAAYVAMVPVLLVGGTLGYLAFSVARDRSRRPSEP